MLKDLNKPQNTLPEFSIAKGKTIEAILNFLEVTLPIFTKDLKVGLLHEDDISQECSIYLNREARTSFFMFHFQHKYPGKKRSSDFSIISTERFASKEPLFVIEAKRLPTPGASRQKEYVVGNSGGVERFKRKFHGNDLPKSAMLGYVQKETFEHWHKEINSWIKELINNNEDSTIKWKNPDLLKFVSSVKNINKYISKHSRVDGQNIEIIHYWLYTN